MRLYEVRYADPNPPTPGDYIGPEGFGSSPESGGSERQGENRIQSSKPFTGRLTNKVRQNVTRLFNGYGVDVKKVDKTRKGYIRVWYNGESLFVPYPTPK